MRASSRCWPKTAAASARSPTQAGRREAAIDIPHQHGASDAACRGDDRHRPPAQPVRRRRSHQHLQFPDGERIDRARRGGCRHDRSLGRSRHLHGAPARHSASDQDHRDAAVRPHYPAPVRRARDRRDAGVGHARSAAVRHRRRRHPQARRAALHRRYDQGDQCSERRDLSAGRLPRLRHPRRDDGDFHRRHRRDAAPARRTRGGAAAAAKRRSL